MRISESISKVRADRVGGRIHTVVSNFRRRTDHHLTRQAMHCPAAVHLKAIVVLQIVDQQLAGGQQMEFAVCNTNGSYYAEQTAFDIFICAQFSPIIHRVSSGDISHSDLFTL